MSDKLVQTVFIRCMAAFIHGSTVRDVPYMPTEQWKALYTLSRQQSLSGALFTALGKTPMPPPAEKRLRRDGFWLLTMYEKQAACVHDIAQVLSDASLPHLFFKGAVTRAYYPQPAMRSMGDIDMIVREEDAARVHDALAERGFVMTERGGDVCVFERDECLIEVHTEVRWFDVNVQDTVPYDTIWEDAVPQSGTTYRLCDEAETAHTIAHLAAHFCAGGCGLRQLMDVAVAYNRFPEEAFWHRVLARLSAVGLDDFAKTLLSLCETWLAVPVAKTFCRPLSEEMLETMREHLMDDGIFGSDERVLLAVLRKERRLQKRGGKFGAAVRRVIPKTSYIQRHYPYAKRLPLLLPIAYVHRLADGVFKNSTIHRRRNQFAKDNHGDLEKELAFFEHIGL